jgi:Gamma-glutamyl cyclotransferase, AIG2-like
MTVILHFAYGSNMSRAVMRRRAPLARPVGTAILANYRFLITADGYASVTPRRGENVQGVLWRLTPRDLVTLAAWERVAGGLSRARILSVRCAGRQSRALIYIARPSPLGRAKIGYMEFVVEAALEWRLPQLYIDGLRGFLPKRGSGAVPPYGKAFRWK